jgi:hypothetical protein
VPLKGEKKKAYDKRYFQKNKNKIYSRIKKRYKKDVGFRLSDILRRRLRHALKNNWKSGSAVQDLGCNIVFLKWHLEAQFQPGMSWENHGEWHIDHIKPLDSFDLTDRKQLLEACHFSNLQPLWAKDNWSKGNKI